MSITTDTHIPKEKKKRSDVKFVEFASGFIQIWRLQIQLQLAPLEVVVGSVSKNMSKPY